MNLPEYLTDRERKLWRLMKTDEIVAEENDKVLPESQEDRLQRETEETDDDSSEPDKTPDPQADLDPVADSGKGEDY